MKKFFTVYVLLTFTSLSSVAQIIQPCVVKQYTQKNNKTPLPGVQVEVRDAGTSISDNNGMLTLKFISKKPGDPVILRTAIKSGFEVMNINDVNQWNISSVQKAFELVMVNSEYFSKLKQNLHQVSTENYKKKYEDALAKLMRQKKENQLKEQEFLRKVTEIEDHYDQQLKNLDAYVDQFARIDLSELSEQEQHFIDMVHTGRLDEAAIAYESLDAVGKYTTALQNVAQLTRDIQKMEDEKIKIQEAATTFLSILNRQIGTLKLAGGQDNFRKAGLLLKRAAIADTTNVDVVLEYAKFALSQRDFSDAERFYLMCLKTSEDNDERSAIVLTDLGNLYVAVGDYTKAESCLHKAKENATQLAKNNPDKYQEMMVKTLIGLGSLYNHTKNKNLAEASYSSALEHLIDLFHKTPDSYRPFLFNIQYNLGLLHMGFNNYTKAEDYFYQALENVTILYDHAPDAYRAELAGTQYNMGNVYYLIQAYSTAEEHYIKALDNYTQQFNLNPDAYRSEYASLLSDLGNYYCSIQNIDKAEDCLVKALEHLTLLFNQNPDAYRSKLANTLNNLGVLYDKNHNYLKAEEYYLKAMENYQHLYDLYPNAYKVVKNNIESNLGLLYIKLKAYNVAEEYLLRVLDNWTLLFNQDPDAYRADLAKAQNNLGMLYDKTNNFEKAEEYYLKGYDNYNHFSKDQIINSHLEAAANNLHNIGALYSSRQKDKALEYYYMALALKKLLMVKDSVAYSPSMAETLSNMGNIYYYEKEYSMAEDCICQALDNFKKVSSQDKGTFQSDIDRLQKNLSVLRSLSEYANASHKTIRKKITMYYTDYHTFSIPDDCNACIHLSGDGNTNLDLYVYDEDGELVYSDERYVDDCDYTFMPLMPMKLKIKIINRGEKTNNYTLNISTW